MKEKRINSTIKHQANHLILILEGASPELFLNKILMFGKTLGINFSSISDPFILYIQLIIC